MDKQSRKRFSDQLIRDEGVKPYAYKDSEGYLTIGVGRLIDQRKGGRLRADEIAYLLSNDIDAAISEVDRRIPWVRNLSIERRAALYNMAFQMGVNGLLGFKNTLEMARRGDFEGAARGMLNSKWAKQTPARARRVSEQFRTGKWV